MNHRREVTLKSTIKPFKIDNNRLTGLKNFTDICKDPLALPSYAQPVQTSYPATKASAEIKAKRPDDKRKVP